ncbi:MAG: ATP-binding cassette domain-containing protein [Chitinophagales bacterium]
MRIRNSSINQYQSGNKKGEKVAIIGKTGSGKSTIAELILRTYDIQQGAININQFNIQDIDLVGYRDKIGYTPQDIFLFSDTIKNNIIFGQDNIANETIEQYAKVAHVHNDIHQLPKQYDTIVGERGVMLSGRTKTTNFHCAFFGEKS